MRYSNVPMADRRRSGGALPRRLRSMLRPVGFIGPFYTAFALFFVLPIAYAIYQSLFSTRRIGGVFGQAEQVFSGLDQYKGVLTNSAFDVGMLRVALYALCLVPLTAVIAVTLALLLEASNLRVARFFRSVYFLPYAVPGVIAALMWGFLYTPTFSPLTELHIHVNVLGSGLILPAIANIGIWAWGGFNVILMTTALAAVPDEVVEAARIDGAGGLRIAWHIKLPLIRPTIIMSMVLGIIGTLQLFTEPTVLATISTAITNDFTPNMFAYDFLTAGNYSYAAAAAVTLALFGFILSFGFLRIARRTVS